MTTPEKGGQGFQKSSSTGCDDFVKPKMSVVMGSPEVEGIGFNFYSNSVEFLKVHAFLDHANPGNNNKFVK